MFRILLKFKLVFDRGKRKPFFTKALVSNGFCMLVLDDQQFISNQMSHIRLKSLEIYSSTLATWKKIRCQITTKRQPQRDGLFVTICGVLLVSDFLDGGLYYSLALLGLIN